MIRYKDRRMPCVLQLEKCWSATDTKSNILKPVLLPKPQLDTYMLPYVKLNFLWDAYVWEVVSMLTNTKEDAVHWANFPEI